VVERSANRRSRIGQGVNRRSEGLDGHRARVAALYQRVELPDAAEPVVVVDKPPIRVDEASGGTGRDDPRDMHDAGV